MPGERRDMTERMKKEDGSQQGGKTEAREEAGIGQAMGPWLGQFISLSPISSSVKKDCLMVWF